MVEPPPSEGHEATITAMSPLAVVGQYLSTNSAKSTFLHNTRLVVKAILSKPPHDQDMQAQSNVVSALQTQVHSLQRPFVKQGETLLNVVKICMVLKPYYQIYINLFQMQRKARKDQRVPGPNVVEIFKDRHCSMSSRYAWF